MIDYYRHLFFRHKVILLAVPLFVALLVAIFIRHKKPEFRSTAVIYTGFATGVSLESVTGSAANYFAVSSAFDNLIHIIKSRATQEEVGIRLLATHLQLKQPDPRTILPHHYQTLIESVPEQVKALVSEDLEQTVENLYVYKNASPDNFIDEILAHSHPHYSLYSLGRIDARRLANSDLLQLTFQCDDPGICRQTVDLFSQVLVKNFRATKASSSDDVVAYFEKQLNLAAQQLRDAEDRYSRFNQNHRIINYYEETKSIAIHKDNFNLSIQNEKMVLAAAERTMKHLESSLPRSDLALLQSQSIIAKRTALAELGARIVSIQVADSALHRAADLDDLVAQTQELRTSLRRELSELQTLNHSPDNLPSWQVLERWVEAAIQADESRARMAVLREYKSQFDKYYDDFSVLGALIKRHEREISVLENEYLELLHSLTLARLKQQNIEIANRLRVLDAPGFPLDPEPRGGKKLLIFALFSGFLLSAGFIVLVDYFDPTIKNPTRAKQLIGLPLMGVLPFGPPKKGSTDLLPDLQPFFRYLNQQLQFVRYGASLSPGQPFFVLFLPIDEKAGAVPLDLAESMRRDGCRILYIRFGQPNQTTVLSSDADNLFGSEREAFQFLPNAIEIKGQGRLDLTPFDAVLIESCALRARVAAPFCSFDFVHHSLLVCRADQAWSNGDDRALKTMQKLVPCRIECVLWGADDWVCRQWLGIRTEKHRIGERLKRWFRIA